MRPGSLLMGAPRQPAAHRRNPSPMTAISAMAVCIVTVLRRRTLTVNFEGSGTGRIDWYSDSRTGGGGSGLQVGLGVPIADSVTITATPDSGSIFSGWSGICTGTGDFRLRAEQDLLPMKVTFEVVNQ